MRIGIFISSRFTTGKLFSGFVSILQFTPKNSSASIFVILEMAKNYSSSNGSVSAEILLSKKDQEQAQAYLMSRLLAALKADPEIHLTNDFNAGLQIAFRGNEVFFDFSDEALTEVLCKFTGAKLAAVIKG